MTPTESTDDRRKLYYSVGELAERFNVEPHKIRYWDEQFDQLDPDESPGGNRQFRARDLDLLKRIYHLVEEEQYTVKGAREKLTSGGEATANPAKQIIEECEQALEEINNFVEQI